MKKLIILILTVILALALCACGSAADKETTEGTSGNVSGTEGGIGGVAAALENAVAEHDAAAFESCVSEIAGMKDTNAAAEANSKAIGAIENALMTHDYEAYCMLDQLVEEAAGSETLNGMLGDELRALQNKYADERPLAYLMTEWMWSGAYRIKVYEDEGIVYSMLLDPCPPLSARSNSTAFHWDRGYVMWNNIQFRKTDEFIGKYNWLMSYSAKWQTSFYRDLVARIDYDKDRILMMTEQDGKLTWNREDAELIYVRASEYVKPITLEDKDLTISVYENGVKTKDALYIPDELPTQLSRYFIYSESGPVTTARGISVGSTWDEVVVAYGHGHQELFVGRRDGMQSYLHKKKMTTANGEVLLENLMDQEITDFMEYYNEDLTMAMRIYFNNDKVTWIGWYKLKV